MSPQAHEALKNLQGFLLDKACESVSEPSENPGHQRRSTRGSEDAIAEDRQSNISPDDLLVCSFFSYQLNLNNDHHFHCAEFKTGCLGNIFWSYTCSAESHCMMKPFCRCCFC